MGLSEEISRLAEQYDPEKEGEALGVRAVIQGAMAMQAHLDRPTPPLKDLVKIREVEQRKDENGDYLPYYTLITESGIRIRVTVEVEA